MKQEKSCGAIVFLKKDSPRLFLILQHRGGHWDFPKGHVEPGESEEQTAIREVKEEAGLDITIVGGFREQIAYSPARGVNKAVIFFVAEAKSEDVQVQKKEISDFRWLTYEPAHKLLSFETARELLRKAEEILNT